jgi:type I restriction enzyme M protein
MSEDQKRVLEQQLWNIANTLRGKMNADEFRDYILGFIFYKYLSEKMDIYANSILKQDKLKFRDIQESTKQGKEYIEAIKEEALEKLGYFLKPSELFGEVAKRGNGNGNKEKESNFILEDLQKILTNIQLSTMGTASEDDFDNLFEDMDLNSTKLGKSPEARNEIIAKVLSHLDKIDFKLESTELDVLGDAYEYLIGQFASGAGKKAGEFYTPQQVSMVLAKLVTTGKTKLKTVYDPTCGSGSLLLRVAKEVKEVSKFYGQEMNRTTYNLARMNMILHGVHYLKFDIKQEDTLEHPQHIDKQFEAIVANPPFSAEWSANPLFTSDDRFSQYGRLAPAGKADYAFVQHMIYHLAENGTMAIVLPHGALYRGGAEQHIRKYIIEDRNYLDAVIGLPANIFYGTGIPTCIMVFKKCRENPENVLFIDSSRFFQKGKPQNNLREEDIEKIIDTYRTRAIIDKYSNLIPVSEISKNDFNLNIPRYVDTYIPELRVDLVKVTNELSIAEKEQKVIDAKLEIYAKELNIEPPFGNNILLLEKYKTGLIQKLFSQEIRFKNENSKPYPEWKRISMGKIGKTYNGLSGKNKDDFGNGKPYIQYKQIFDDSKIDINKFDFVRISENENQSKAQFGDVFFTTSSETPHEIGFSSVLLDEVEDLYLNSFCFGYRPNSLNELNPVFAQFLFRSEIFRREILKLAQGSTRYNMSKIELMKTLIPIPIIEEQIKIATILTAISEKIKIISKNNILLNG